MPFSAASLRAVLEARMPPDATGLVIGISGGVDSACLAAAAAQLAKLSIRNLPLRAVHVDHGLQSAAKSFRHASTRICSRLELPLKVIDARVELSRGESIEAAARDARYAAVAADLAQGECFITAHHALDQAETVLLQLLRGAGLKGLSAMPMCRRLGDGWHLRPMLDVTQSELRQFAAAAGIEGVADPMNTDCRFDRAYLRTQIWPRLEQRWPGAATALSRAARHAADAQVLLDESASVALQKLRDGDTLSVTGLRALPAKQQVNALRCWIMSRVGDAPPASRLAEALRQLMTAQDDHLPAVLWAGHALRRYRQRIFLTAAEPACVGEARRWVRDDDTPLALGAQGGRLSWTSQRGGLDAARLPATLVVRQRVGGEMLQPHCRAKTQSLQHLCQSHGVLPWMRDALPLIVADGVLVAVADLWLDARWCVPPGAPGLGIGWQEAPIIV